ncbi:MAG: cardiolipin synthase [Bacteroidaceae bacterium]|nr:cardiolipin synthase [Bacteroidaceae bacterium]
MMSEVLAWVLSGLYLLLVIGTVLVVLLQNRQPERTIAWVVAIVLLPVVGLVAFYFFGRDMRLRRRHRRRRGSFSAHVRHEGHHAAGDAANDPFLPLKHLCEEEFDAPLQPLGETTLFTDGTAFVDALLHDIAEARSYIFLETYIIEDDNVGRRVATALAEAAQRGVDVRLLYDDVGCWNVPERFFKALHRSGVSTEAFMPVRFPSLTHKINYRNHRKVCVVDGQAGYIGGMNLADRYLGHEGFVWRDMHLRLSGAPTLRLGLVFESDWEYVTTGRALPRPSASDAPPTSPRPTVDEAAVQIVTSDPMTPVPQLMTAYIWAVSHARRYLYVQTPYFMPTEPFLQAMKTAAMSGADVRLMVPRKPDGIMLRRINDSYVSEMLAAGVRVYFYDGGFLHSKCIAMDDSLCAVGSANMDFRSLLNNIEVAALIYDSNVCRAVREQFQTDMAACEEIDAQRWARRPLRRRILESATRLFSPLF